MVISASLSQIQNYLLRDDLSSKPELRKAFDTALTGCMTVYGCLDVEVQRLQNKVEDGTLGWKDKAKYLWNEADMEQLLIQIRGQQTALTLLLQGLQMESLSDIKSLLEENGAVLEKVAMQSNSLLMRHPSVKVADSIFEKKDADSTRSNAGDEHAEFTFDDEIVNSKAYRRALTAALAQRSASVRRTHKSEVPSVEGDSGLKDTDEKEQEMQQLSEEILKELEMFSNSKEPLFNDSDTIKAFDFGDHHTINEPEPPDSEEIGHDAEEQPTRKVSEEHPDHATLLDELERGMLPFMPPLSTELSRTDWPLVGDSTTASSEQLASPRRSTFPLGAKDQAHTDSEAAPPLPTRRRPPMKANTMPLDSAATSKSSSSDADSGYSSIRPAPLVTRSARKHAAGAVKDPRDSGTAVIPQEENKPETASPLIEEKKAEEVVTLTDTSNDTTTFFGGGEDNVAHAITTDEQLNTLANLASNSDEQYVWESLIRSEEAYVQRLAALTSPAGYAIIGRREALVKHIGVLPLAEELLKLNKQYLLQPLQTQFEKNWCSPFIFQKWCKEAQVTYRAYCQRIPHSESAMDMTLERDKAFREYLSSDKVDAAWRGQGWKSLLKEPMLQIDRYVSVLTTLTRLSKRDNGLPTSHTRNCEEALDLISRLQKSCEDAFRRAVEREELHVLHHKIQTLDNSFLEKLDLMNSGRRVLHHGKIALAARGRGPWMARTAYLLDNYLFWVKEEPVKRNFIGKVTHHASSWILEAPLNTEELIYVVNSKVTKTGALDELPRGQMLLPIPVKSGSHFHTIATFKSEDTEKWMKAMDSLKEPTEDDVKSVNAAADAAAMT